MNPKNTKILPATTALPTERLFDIHDSLALAIDAIKGSNLSYRNISEARSYVRAGLRELNKNLPVGVVA